MRGRVKTPKTWTFTPHVACCGESICHNDYFFQIWLYSWWHILSFSALPPSFVMALLIALHCLWRTCVPWQNHDKISAKLLLPSFMSGYNTAALKRWTSLVTWKAFSCLTLWLNGGNTTGLQLFVKTTGGEHIVWPCTWSSGEPTFLSELFAMTSWPHVVLFSVSPVRGVLWSTWRSVETLFYHMLLSHYSMIGFCQHGIWINFLKWASA